TVAAIERHLLRDGLVHRYTSTASVDGLPPGEGAFLACTFWLADNYMLLGRDQDARRIFERLLALRNDVGLLSEEYDLQAQRLVGNFPQALSHIGLVTTALHLSPQEAAPAAPRQDSREGGRAGGCHDGCREPRAPRVPPGDGTGGPRAPNQDGRVGGGLVRRPVVGRDSQGMRAGHGGFTPHCTSRTLA